MAISDRIDTRFLARIVVGKESCWFWQGAINNKGYGKVKRDGKQLYVHRYAYEQIVRYFARLTLREFALVPDHARDGGLIVGASQAQADAQQYGCGCFWFVKERA